MNRKKNNFREITWKLNEEMANLSIFGSYVARVFKEIN